MKHLSLFEVGCAYGFFLEIAKLYFASTRGIDLCESIIDHAQAQLGVQASSGNFIEIQPESNQVDVVCMWDTIEHLRSPEQFTAHAAKLLAPGGHLFLTTGDISSINAQLRKANWRLIHPPSHMHYFSRNSIRVLLESQGFEIREICYVGFYRSLSNTVANLCRGSKLTSLINYTSRSRLCYYLNLFDIMFIAARKR
jgi:predicted TPR repeat methyltransferase